MVYVAPMKALLQEMARNFNSRLRSFGIKVGELTGDSQMEPISYYVRLVGFSATLPNYPDLATFLHVDQSKGIFCVLLSLRPPAAVCWRHRRTPSSGTRS